ncbi:nucleotidyl transferase AbiEii/AbiGii toxin family protein [Nocardia cyriacigeorgica]|uniref:Nucleotidyl transferase AbiEii/AbiGii toxin family protein n=1 Tax=Nocardia cyriacigeorgica TaxID=135487 RepID=A0A6P1D246_9NOCA|nr:nucleotidyl transferase AbiEii/AbiGii toxin family protein [Nocardia cyriacigeorgica]NEW40340.1 nucleotidyl transferase AbiEii/AbiGii toxin family protein [Nocardia cyriacigeorgica]NEW43461.1 nucleotidyl transferase AbiEii/AbiGii toxin family protein [Nocardia cyriacigeorgica]NEW50712.1 nucleotidyl transferase AbiEii/AbiGii toxin family protein [Nocardia cyriacigeorgica]NEW54800.1 nucleotidyl transferase AbiEii/AbiGii toxin family protein [Nocardia cyriacigeorgica]
MNNDERDTVAAIFGVSPEQVERDHLISHLLAVISDRFGDRLHFIGGTALARTHLPEGRLSEDIDLVALGNRTALAGELDALLPRAVARLYGRLEWTPSLSEVSDTMAANLRSAGGLNVKVQLLSSHNRILWPTERRALEQRYHDAPAAALDVPTLPAFAAGKTATWHDRRAPRDLWDMWALAGIGAIDDAAANLYRRYGPTNRLPGPHLFERPPSVHDWNSQLAGQTRLTVTAEAALATVRQAWAHISGGGGEHRQV